MPTTVTSTIKSSGGDYTTLTAWEAAKQGDLVTADQVQVAECYTFIGGLDDALTIDGSTTDSTRFLKVTVASGNRHGGIPLAGFYLKTTANFQADRVTVSDDYTVVEYLDAYCNYYGTTGIVISGGCSNAVVKNCIGKGKDGGAYGIKLMSGTAINCLVYQSDYCGSGDFGAGTWLNCVASGNSYAWRQYYNTNILKNCVAYNNTYTYKVDQGSFDAGCTHNATSSASDDAPGGNSQTGVSSSDFVNAASNDFHIVTSSTKLYQTGTDLSGTFTTDVDGDTWAATWSIGFDQPSAAAAASFLPPRSGQRFQHMMVR